MGDDDLRGRFRRDFTREPIQSGRSQPNAQAPAAAAPPPPAAPLPALEIPHFETSQSKANHSHRPKKKNQTKKKLVILVFFLILAGAGAGYYKYYYLKPAVPKDIASQSKVPILYPQELPSDYHINQQSFNISAGNIITYYATNQTGDKIVFSLQGRPSNFDYATFYSKGLSDSTMFNTSLGQAAVGTTDGHLLGSLATERTWIIVSSTSKNIRSSDLKTILESLKEVNKPNY